MRRRPFLRKSAALTTAVLAGCASLRSNHDPRANDLTAINETDGPVSADVVVALPDGETVSSTRHRLTPGENTIENLAEYGTYDLTVAIDGTPAASHEWHVTDCNHLTVRVRSDEIAFGEGEC
ncbi:MULTISPECIES: hypothetical protein [Halorussus]|uniref:hypothetical protein n=1 Tax=Halorussus TaxID=1070314 RepID=UPI0020A11E3A|nr:hypothetical protein [Halorussus vallis]USZ74211.1 hypothetical protein NGM07_12225 [Halorussus vallis]